MGWGGVGWGGVGWGGVGWGDGSSSQPDGRVHNQGSCGCELSRLWGRKDGRVHNQASKIREEIRGAERIMRVCQRSH